MNLRNYKFVIGMVVALLIATSFGVNVYFAWRMLRSKVYTRGVKDTISVIVRRVEKTGKVRLSAGDKSVVLVPEKKK